MTVIVAGGRDKMSLRAHDILVGSALARFGDGIVDRELVRLTFASLGLAFPTVPRFGPSDLPNLYAALCENHQFESFELQGDGAELATEGVRTLTLSRQTLIISEYPRTDIQPIKRNFSDMVNIVRDRLSIPLFFAPRLVLRVAWKLSEDDIDATAALRGVLTLKEDQLRMLTAEEIGGIGFTFNMDRGNHHHTRLEVGPDLGDTSFLELELTTVLHDQIETIPVVEELLQKEYDYLFQRVLPFVETFMP